MRMRNILFNCIFSKTLPQVLVMIRENSDRVGLYVLF